MTALAAAFTADPVESIRTVLRREVSDVLHRHLPALALVPPAKVYDRVLDDPLILAQAFRLLRERPELFQDVVVTPARLFPGSDEDPLACGRTLAEVVALLVRACARRYFRRRLRGHAPVFRPPQPGPLARLALTLGLAKARPQPKRPAPASPGERLFRAMRDWLLYEWQVPLIPTYAALSPELVTALGPQLLEYRDPLKVQLLSEHSTERALVEGKAPLLLGPAHRLLTGAGDSINADILWSVCQKMRMAALFPGFDTAELRKAVSAVAATSPQALKLLMPVLGGDIRLFTLYLFTAYGVFGPIRYRQVLGADGRKWMLEAMARRIARGPALKGTHEEMKATIESWLDQAVQAIAQDEADRAEVHRNLDSMPRRPGR
ncbi:hypothetical protein [Magnetospirillum sp. UT-4]|uniref:hypothetical protein n=1 Tax=Magnetospirillum sp. UT-4 TaxID=2681467 RepID=UPI001383D402|nr:hypothetical protein [Magnetospirillum sp. UT-4]CAA7626241.1 conserved hypothetical protein [Magnetospirillum sp. UT-4]